MRLVDRSIDIKNQSNVSESLEIYNMLHAHCCDRSKRMDVTSAVFNFYKCQISKAQQGMRLIWFWLFKGEKSTCIQKFNIMIWESERQPFDVISLFTSFKALKLNTLCYYEI